MQDDFDIAKLLDMMADIPEPLIILCHSVVAQKVQDAFAQLPVTIPLPVVKAEDSLHPGTFIVIDTNQIRKDFRG